MLFNFSPRTRRVLFWLGVVIAVLMGLWLIRMSFLPDVLPRPVETNASAQSILPGSPKPHSLRWRRFACESAARPRL